MNITTAQEIQGWMNLKELTWLAEQASKSMLILEVGSYKGRSARVLADNTKGHVVCCDPWEGNYIFDSGKHTGINCEVYPEFIANLQDHISSGRVIAMKGKFLEQKWISSFNPDFIFLDGDHRYETLKKEIILARKLLKPGGVLAGHDYGDHYWPGVKLAVDEMIPSFKVCETIWIAK